MQKDCSVIREEYAEAAGGLEIGQHQEHGSPPNSETVDQQIQPSKHKSKMIITPTPALEVTPTGNFSRFFSQ
jgi:hypothetical protein